MKVSVCCEMLPCSSDFAKAVEEIKKAGTDTVEFWKWSNKDLSFIAETVKKNGMKISTFCVDSESEELSKHIFTKALTSPKKELLLKAIKESVPHAKALGAKKLIVTVGDRIEGLSYEQQMENVVSSLNYVKGYLEEEGIMLLVEPINYDERKDFAEPRALPVIELLKKVNSPNIKLLYDTYHQGMTGDLSVKEITENIGYIGHIHIGDVPGRGEPGTGDIDFDSIFKAAKASGYDEYFGIECFLSGSLNDAVEKIINI